jgi:hypothetical protein
MNSWMTVLIIAIILVSLDKGLTAFNIESVRKNNPGVSPYSIEKNPIARFTFEKFGMIGGTAIFWVFSIVTFLLATYLLSYPARIFAPNNPVGLASYAMVLLYFLVLGNNFYFAFKYNGLI